MITYDDIIEIMIPLARGSEDGEDLRRFVKDSGVDPDDAERFADMVAEMARHAVLEGEVHAADALSSTALSAFTVGLAVARDLYE